MAIQFRRGNEADLVAEQLLPAEPAFSLDTKRFLIGDGEGVAAVPTEAQVVSIATSLMSQRLPVGTILMWPGTTAPAGTLILQGQLVNRADYPDLCQFAQNSGNIVDDAQWSNRKGSFSTGNGSTTFRLPDLRGRVPVGYDSTQAEFNVLGQIGGAKTVILTINEMPKHGHRMPYRQNLASGSNAYDVGGGNNLWSTEKTEEVGGGQAHNNLQPYATVNFIIIAKADTTASSIESALAELISQTQAARDSANQAAQAVQQALDDIENMVADGVATANSYTDTVAAGKVDKVEGKGLSTNDYTNADKAKVENLPENTNAELALKANAADVESALSDKADKSALSETNLRVAEIGKDLSDYKAALSQLNPNQEAKQTISDYGIVPLPVNAANGHMDVAVGGNTEIDENGMYHTVSAMRIVSESEDKTQRTELYIPDVGELRSLPNGVCDEISGAQRVTKTGIGTIGEERLPQPLNFTSGWGTAGGGAIVSDTSFSAPNAYGGIIKNNVSPANAWLLIEAAGTVTGTSLQIRNSISATGSISIPVGNFNIKRLVNWGGPTVLYLSLGAGGACTLSKLSIKVVTITDTPENPSEAVVDNDKVIYKLATPVTTPINVSGTLLSYPKGTVYAEPVLPVAGIYTANGISVTNTDFPIESIERIYKIDFATGVETEINPLSAVVAGNGLGFTHPDLADGDIVFFTYYYSNTGTQPKISATYFDSRYVLKDTVTGKFYKKVETVQNGQLVTQLVEVS